MGGIEVALVKLGGSVVTDKSKLRSFAGKNASMLLGELSKFLGARDSRRAIVVHGGGSFGHIIAKRFSISEGFQRDSQLAGFAEVRNDMRDLNSRLIASMRSLSLPAISFPPESLFRIESRRIVFTDISAALKGLEIGLIPVSFGDAVIDMQRSFTILSGDTIMEELSRIVRPSVSIFCTDVDGVFSSDPKSSAKSSLLRHLTAGTKLVAGSATVDDVTGGMEGKLRVLFEVAKYSGRTYVVNGRKPGRLLRALQGRSVTGTEVFG